VLTINRTFPLSAIVAIWSLRLVPIAMWALMFVFNSGSIKTPQLDPQFWHDAIAIGTMIAIIWAWNYNQKVKVQIGFIAYLLAFFSLILRNPYGVMTTHHEGFAPLNVDAAIFHSFWFGLVVLALGIATEALIYYFRKSQRWAWWLAFGISILYVASILFFFQGSLGIWSLLNVDTKKAFKIGSFSRTIG
jgi:hypothetical protein